jgi:adenosylhomocysteine nucleosidase
MQKIGLIGAMNEEIELFMDRIQNKTTVKKAGISFHEGEFLGHQTVICKSGVGKVNAAVCTQILIDDFKVDQVLFTGVAGALHPDLNIGDIVISTDAMQHDMDVTALGFDKGMIPFEEKSIFKADPVLLELAYHCSLQSFKGTTMKGRILSGDQFVADRSKVKQLHEDFEGLCTEMEGAAVAQVCSMNDIPFVIIRSMSDKADGSAHVNFGEFTQQASQHSCDLIEAMLKESNAS